MIQTQNIQRIFLLPYTFFFKLAKFMQCFNIVFVIQQHLLIEEVLISNGFFLPLEISAVFIYVNIKFLVKSTNSHKQKKKNEIIHIYIYWWIKCPTYSPHRPNSRTHFFHKVIVTYVLVLNNNLLKFACSVDIMSISPKDAKLLSYFISP